MTLLNNVIGVLPVLALGCLRGEHHQLPEALSNLLHVENRKAVYIFASGCVGLSLGFFSIVVQKEISATSMLVLSSLARMTALIFSVLIFADAFTWISGTGCFLSFVGMFWYGLAQHEANTTEKSVVSG